MEILNGLFRSKCEFLTNDNFGGNEFKVFSYSYLLFFKNEVFTFSIKGNSENFVTSNIIECIYYKEVTILNGLYSIDLNNKIICDFEFKPFMAGRLKLIGEIVNESLDLKFNAYSNDEIFWSNKTFSFQDLSKEISYLCDKGIKTVVLKEGTNLDLNYLILGGFS
jgi:hypothetical protein